MSARTITGLAVMVITASVFATQSVVTDSSVEEVSEVTSVIEWGSCPCVQADGAWNKQFVINEQTRTFPYTLESVDQTQAIGYARTTNNLLDTYSGRFIGELDVTVSPERGTLYCSSYNYNVYEGETTAHLMANDHEAVSDCRSGLFDLAGQDNPLGPQS